MIDDDDPIGLCANFSFFEYRTFALGVADQQTFWAEINICKQFWQRWQAKTLKKIDYRSENAYLNLFVYIFQFHEKI